ncbi:MAG: putative ABC transport system ATP-binding protein [Planctomycetota bacterium]|jgi:putative ABC transport system ATP-binding protein
MTQAQSQPQSALEIQDLRFAYPGAQGFRLEVPEFSLGVHERAALIGPSGCGKTTFLHLAAGILSPDAGQVSLAGERLSPRPDAQRRARRVTSIGLVFQEFELLEYLSAEDNLLLPYRITGALKLTQEVRARGRALAQATGIADVLARRPGTLSQGQRQRLALCRALVTQPALVLADEPTGNLDPHNAALVRSLLLEQCAAAKTALLVVTHDHASLDEFDTTIDMSRWVNTGVEQA